MEDSAAEVVQGNFVRLRIPAELRFRHVAMRTVSAAVRVIGHAAAPVTEDWVHEVVSAFGEAFNNVILHGHPQRGASPGAWIEVELAIETERETAAGDGSLAVHMRDQGASFDPTTLPAPDLDELPEGGLGVYIMKSCMDEVSYEPGSINVLSMTKRFR